MNYIIPRRNSLENHFENVLYAAHADDGQDARTAAVRHHCEIAGNVKVWGDDCGGMRSDLDLPLCLRTLGSVAWLRGSAFDRAKQCCSGASTPRPSKAGEPAMPEAFACAVLIASKLSEIFDGSMICCPGQSPILCINRLLVGNHVRVHWEPRESAFPKKYHHRFWAFFCSLADRIAIDQAETQSPVWSTYVNCRKDGKLSTPIADRWRGIASALPSR